MKLQKLKNKIIAELGEDLKQDINDCKNGLELLHVLDQYGYKYEESLNILFNILISQD